MSRDYDKAYLSRWFESFVMFCEQLPPRARAAGHDMDRFWIISAAARLRSLAQPDGELRGARGTPYSIAQLTPWLGRSDKTVRGLLRYLEETGWILTAPRTNLTVPEVRRLVIPTGALVAWPGWPRPVKPAASSGNDQVQPLPHDSGNDQVQQLPDTLGENSVFSEQGSPVMAEGRLRGRPYQDRGDMVPVKDLAARFRVLAKRRPT